MSMSRGQPAAKEIVGFGKRWMSLAPKVGWWRDVPMAPPDQTFSITDAFLNDQDPRKVDLGVGAYRDDNGKPVVLDCVRKAEARVCGNGLMEYLPMAGSKRFSELAMKLAYGEDAECIASKRVAAVQTVSGTSACRLMAELQKKFEAKMYMYIPYPTWNNHHNIWKDAQCKSQTYRYYDSETKGLKFAGLLADVRQAPEGSFWLLHACAHNPTGVDPTTEQWQELSALMRDKKHFPFFDLAYQGFASGDVDKDAQAIRIFVADGHQIGLSQSFVANMGLYGQRVGCLSLVTDDQSQAAAVTSQLQQILRPIYSSPPIHAAEIVSTILSDPELKALWLTELKGMSDRLKRMRALLRENMEKQGSEHSWKHFTEQVGMYSYTGVTPEQVDRLTKDYHIYLTRKGRISIPGINPGNVEYVANALHEVSKRVEGADQAKVQAPTTLQPPARRRIKWNGGDWRRNN